MFISTVRARYSISTSAGAITDALEPGAKRRQIDFFGLPAFVPQQAARSFAVGRDVTQKFHDGGIVGLQFGGAAFHGVDHGRQAQVAIQRIAALLVQIADGRAHLIVGVGADIFHEKVDQARVALQNSQDLERAVGGLGCANGGGGLGGRLALLLWRKTKLLRDVGGQFAGE